MKILRLAAVMILMFKCICGYSQNIEIESFTPAPTDLTANTPGTMVYDQNGDLCALIKLESTFRGFFFDTGIMGVTSVEEKVGETWVYVPFGVKKITIQHPQLGTVRSYQIPCAIEQGRTYILRLKASGESKVDSSKKQKVRIQVFPKNATVEIKGISLPLDADGICEQDFSFGIYEVVVSAPKYHTMRTSIEVNDPDRPIVSSIHLKQAFGWLNIAGTGNEEVMIDGNTVNYSPNRQMELSSGVHRIQIVKPLYKPYETTVEIKDSVEFRINPEFVPNHRDLEFNVNLDSDIFVDGIRVTYGKQWSGKLEYGLHTIECRKESHRTSKRVFEVTPETRGPIVLDSPTPIYGSLTVNVSPAGAEVYVDNQLAGKSPGTFNVLVGQRSVSIKHPGYDPYNTSVTIEEGESILFNKPLSNIVTVSIKSNPDANMYLDGNRIVGGTPWTGNLTSGEYTLLLQKYGYHDINKRIQVDPQHRNFTFNMDKQYYFKTAFVLGGTVSTDLKGLTAGGYAGVYLNGLYLEGNYQYGLSTSEEIIWYDLSTGSKAASYTYSPSMIGGKLGYGLILGTRTRITPYVGATGTMLKGVLVKESVSEFAPNSCSAVSINAGLKLSYAVASCIELNVASEYGSAIYKTDIFNSISNASPAIKSWTEGMNINLGIGIFL